MFEDVTIIFQSSPWLFYGTVAFLGLSVGSFLNVVAYRLPIMMERDWKLECHEFLELDPPKLEDKVTAFNLATPASACPNCDHKLHVWENIPIFSYLFLKAKCSSCANKISIQYPAVELFTSIASLLTAHVFGVTIQTIAALFFCWTLIALTLIDLKKQLLPDNITLPLLWLGIVLNLNNIFTDLKSSIIGAIAGYLILWSVYQLFKLLTKKEGMGFGDFKLLAALGAWVGFSYLPQIILISSVVGSIAGISMLLIGKTKQQQPIPFGPYLAVSGWIALLWGESINTTYLSFL
ncbi:Leader peptidase (Prepilin peptidase) / N-methyltransferase [hydrothermal vent metagenome]|uniref:Leader peptidase (Prepilin peptidase) / N-methyltransferase n=1 Tax=hydrothermal vent metagenome TaxID=652676 RepID=A0A3B0W6T7_9ZZZZ